MNRQLLKYPKQVPCHVSDDAGRYFASSNFIGRSQKLCKTNQVKTVAFSSYVYSRRTRCTILQQRVL
jgi:hypothetical protein